MAFNVYKGWAIRDLGTWVKDAVVGVAYVSIGEPPEVMNGFPGVDALGSGLKGGSVDVNPDSPSPVQEVSSNNIARIVEEEQLDILMFFSTIIPAEAEKGKQAGKLQLLSTQ